MNNKEAAEYIKAHCNPDMTQKTQWEIAMVMAVKALLSGQQKGNIEEDPTVDAVKVVRCKDCRYYYRHEFFGKPYFTCDIANRYMTGDIVGVGFEPPEDWFCADGERREE